MQEAELGGGGGCQVGEMAHCDWGFPAVIKGQVLGEKQCGRKCDTSENYNRKSTSVGNLGKVIQVLAPAPSYANFICIC